MFGAQTPFGQTTQPNSPFTENVEGQFMSLQTPFTQSSFTPRIPNTEGKTSPIPNIQSDGTQVKRTRTLNFSRIKFDLAAVLKEGEFDTFLQAVATFEREEGTPWDRTCLSKETKTLLTSQWRRWEDKITGEEWKDIPFERFSIFIKYVKHSYFKHSTDSNYIDRSVRIVNTLKENKISLDPRTGVRQLESILGKFSKSDLEETPLETMSSLDIEQVREAFHRYITPLTSGDQTKAKKFISLILSKGPDATPKSSPILQGTTLTTWLDAMILEAASIES